MKLADPDEGHGYGRERLDLMEAEYRKFLALHLAYADAGIVPCKLGPGLTSFPWRPP